MAHRDAQDARIADILGDVRGNVEYYQLIDNYAVWFFDNR